VERSDLDLLLPIVAGTGLAGAYLFGWLTQMAVGAAAPVGMVLFGSLLVATAAGIVYALLRKIPLGRLGDVVAAPIALGIACGRMGCFLAGCCYGKQAAWGVKFPRHSFAWEHHVHEGMIDASAACSLAVHPVQLYEAGLMIVLAAVLLVTFRRRRVAGESFLWLALGYGAVRFGLEFLRADNPPAVLVLTFSQAVSLMVLAIAGATLAARRMLADRLELRMVAS
jgi:phosphatidylglycerol:prolipoprotein diacylglycerol transferase